MASITGTDRDDDIDGTRDADDIFGEGGDDSIFGQAGRDTIHGGSGDDFLAGGNGGIGYAFQGAGDVIYGDAGDDVLAGGRMYGGIDDDTYVLFSGAEVAIELAGEGHDKVVLYNHGATAPAANIRLAANIEDLDLDTDWNGLSAYGNDLDNLITGGKGERFDGAIVTTDVSLYGLDGDDTLSAWEGDDTLDGGAGDDVMYQNLGNDTYVGGSGDDTLVAYRFGATIDLSITGPRTVGDYRQSFSGIENLIGSGYADTLIGDGANNFIQGGYGSDRLDGGAGLDTVSYDGYDRGVDVNLAAGTAIDSRYTDRISNFEDVLGSDFNDHIVGSTAGNVLEGGRGNDDIDGGTGFDRASYFGAASGVRVDLSRTGYQSTGADGADRLASIEGLIGSAYADVLIGNAADNTLFGAEGDDQLTGGSGNDVLDGGLGRDFASYATAGAAVTVDLSARLATGGAGRDTLNNIENVLGSASGDTIVGDGNRNLLYGLGGGDLIDGGLGDDTLDGGTGADRLTGGGGRDTFDFTATLGGGNIDTIVDFVAADDFVRLGQAAFAGLTAGALADGAFRAGAVALDADDRILYDTATGTLSFDRDGSGTGYQAVAFARVTPGTAIGAGNFVVI